jgi:hypothetical protein
MNKVTATMMQQNLKPTRSVNVVSGKPTVAPVYCESGFYKLADVLRAQFEEQMLGAREQSAGMTPLTYAFSASAYQFLTASAERIFTPEILEDLIGRIRSWAGETLGMSRVSTPQARVFVGGCKRNLLRDDIASPWRYSLSLTRRSPGQKIGRMTVIGDDLPERASDETRISTVLNSHMDFNQLMVHQARSAYSIEIATRSMNPLEGAVLLDGYLW